MASPFGTLVVIVEPGGRVAGHLPEVERTLQGRMLDYRIVEADAPGHGSELARDTLEEGGRFLVAVGGDGIVHDVVNGMMEGDAPIVPDPVLGVVAAGAENDFVRTFGLPLDAGRAAAHLAGDVTYPIDVGHVVHTDVEGREIARYFVNVAEAGLGGDVVARAGGVARTGPRYFLAFWRSVMRSRRADVQVHAARKSFQGKAFNVVVGNGRFGTGGFRVSPRSFPGDGVLEVLVLTGPRSDAFTLLPLAYKGEQVPHPNIVELRGRDVRVEATPSLRLQVDGRLVGTTPATFRAIPRAILLKV